MTTAQDPIVAQTQEWLTRAVIGLNLCPFAKGVHVKEQIRYAVSEAQTPEQLLEDLINELSLLRDADPEKIDTTLLIHPQVLNDFDDYNAFLDVVDAVIDEMGLEGELQVATFHPQYQFEDTEPEDVENCTNRSPYPILHLLRESSIEKAVEAFPDAADIYENNMETLRKLGVEGWKRLWIK